MVRARHLSNSFWATIGINNSLTVLGLCIRAVADGKSHVPWRDAVLCQFLRTSFETKVGAGTHTAVVVNVSPEYEDETLCTLRFGEAVAGASNKSTVVVGQNADGQISKLSSEVSCLRAKADELKRDGQDDGFVKGCIITER